MEVLEWCQEKEEDEGETQSGKRDPMEVWHPTLDPWEVLHLTLEPWKTQCPMRKRETPLRIIPYFW